MTPNFNPHHMDQLIQHLHGLWLQSAGLDPKAAEGMHFAPFVEFLNENQEGFSLDPEQICEDLGLPLSVWEKLQAIIPTPQITEVLLGRWHILGLSHRPEPRHRLAGIAIRLGFHFADGKKYCMAQCQAVDPDPLIANLNDGELTQIMQMALSGIVGHLREYGVDWLHAQAVPGNAQVLYNPCPHCQKPVDMGFVPQLQLPQDRSIDPWKTQPAAPDATGIPGLPDLPFPG